MFFNNRFQKIKAMPTIIKFLKDENEWLKNNLYIIENANNSKKFINNNNKDKININLLDNKNIKKIIFFCK